METCETGRSRIAPALIEGKNPSEREQSAEEMKLERDIKGSSTLMLMCSFTISFFSFSCN